MNIEHDIPLICDKKEVCLHWNQLCFATMSRQTLEMLECDFVSHYLSAIIFLLVQIFSVCILFLKRKSHLR